MLIHISHKTEYIFRTPVSHGLQQLRLTPKSRNNQHVQSWSTHVTGGEIELDYNDHHNNHVELLNIAPEATHLHIHCEGHVETADNNGIIGNHVGFAPLWLFKRSTALTKAGPLIQALVRNVKPNGSIPSLHELSNSILNKVTYETEKTHAYTTAEEAIKLGHGVCQDHAHIFIAAARCEGIPARYVSGYLLVEGEKEHTASHAWAEAYISNVGWVGFDISNGISPDERYVRVATGLDYRDAAPVRGLRFGQNITEMDESLIVSIRIEQ